MKKEESKYSFPSVSQQKGQTIIENYSVCISTLSLKGIKKMFFILKIRKDYNDDDKSDSPKGFKTYEDDVNTNVCVFCHYQKNKHNSRSRKICTHKDSFY